MGKKIDISEKMVEAGLHALWDSAYGQDSTVSSLDVVEAVVEAALSSGGYSVTFASDRERERVKRLRKSGLPVSPA